jgi:hypothetical protein
VIDAQRVADPLAASSEWDSVFRGDVASFLDDAVLEPCIAYGRPLELPPRAEFEYVAWTDPSGGSGHDAYTVCLSHRENGKYVIDLVRGSKPGSKFDPAELTASYAALIKEYRCRSVSGDHYSGEWAANAWAKAGITYVRAEAPKSVIYLETLPLFSRGAVELPEHQRLLTELRLLERRVHKSGRETVDHGASKHAHDDYANSACGALHLLSAGNASAEGYYEALKKACREGPDTPPPPLVYPDVAKVPSWFPRDLKEMFAGDTTKKPLPEGVA